MTTDQPANQVAKLYRGIKKSFRSYVEGVGGANQTGGAAERAADRAFIVAPTPAEGPTRGVDGSREGAGRFVGEVRCKWHGGMLESLLDPHVEIGPGLVVPVRLAPR